MLSSGATVPAALYGEQHKINNLLVGHIIYYIFMVLILIQNVFSINCDETSIFSAFMLLNYYVVQ